MAGKLLVNIKNLQTLQIVRNKFIKLTNFLVKKVQKIIVRNFLNTSQKTEENWTLDVLYV
jgi:hypothetical protein